MEMIIDIPEHDKNVIERFVRGDGCEDMPPSIIENLIRAIYFATPLAKHDAEIIKETVASVWGKPPYIELLDKIRVELHATAEMHEDNAYYLREEWIDEIINKYKMGG